MIRRRQAVTLGVAGMSLALALAGCGGVRTDGAVQEGLSVGARPRAVVRVLPDGPVAGASAEQVVRGFLRAGVGVDDNEHAVAREFFTGAARDRWQPERGVWVYASDGSLAVKARGSDLVDVTATMVGFVDAVGRYTAQPVNTTRTATFGLRLITGQWRIASAPVDFGLWLSEDDVDRTYSPYEVNFVSTTQTRAPATARALVPDVRWLPVSNALATTLARAQLQEVPDYLKGAAVSGIPSGTLLDPNAVSVIAGVAQVSLSEIALQATAGQRQLMAAQFVATLRQVPDLTAVQLTAGGTQLQPPISTESGSLAALGVAAAPSLTAANVALRAGSALAWYDRSGLVAAQESRRVAASAKVALPKVGPGWTDLAVSRDGRDVAAVSGDGREISRWRDGKSARLPVFATRLSRPAYDGSSDLWVTGRNGSRTTVYLVDVDEPVDSGKPVAIDAPWLADRLVVTLRVAPDDTRVAVVSTAADGTDTQVAVAGVLRHGGHVSGLTDPRRVGHGLTLATDLVWVGPTRLALVARSESSESLRPYLLLIGGAATPLAAVKGALTVTALGGERGLLVLTDSDELWLRVGSGWRDLGEASAVAVPGD